MEKTCTCKQALAASLMLGSPNDEGVGGVSLDADARGGGGGRQDPKGETSDGSFVGAGIKLWRRRIRRGRTDHTLPLRAAARIASTGPSTSRILPLRLSSERWRQRHRQGHRWRIRERETVSTDLDDEAGVGWGGEGVVTLGWGDNTSTRTWAMPAEDLSCTDGDDFLVDVELPSGWESHRVLIKEIPSH
jgi:hypothetical protein